jgi:hypothetical protein
MTASGRIFQPNPAGFDFPELVEELFLPDAARKARAELAVSAEEFSGTRSRRC